MFMRAARPIALALALATLAGCAAQRPGLPAGALAKRPAKVSARDVDVVAMPTVAPEFRLPLAEEGFTRLMAAFPWKVQAPRTDLYYDAWDGQGFRRAADPEAPKLRVKVKDAKAEWQISRVLSRHEVARSGLPVAVTVSRAWSGKLAPDQAEHLLRRTHEFFLWLEAGGEPLRQRAREVDLAWRGLSWPGMDILFPAGATPGLEAPSMFPTAEKRRHGWTTEIPRDEVGGGLKLHLNFDEARDADGRWVDTFEIEAEPLEPLAPEGYDGAAVDFGRALAARGLTADELAGGRGDATAFTARQLQQQ